MELGWQFYFYAILLIATGIELIVSLVMKRWDLVPVLVVAIFLFGIGMSFNGQVCPFIMCLGATPGQGN